jgi:putative transposase
MPRKPRVFVVGGAYHVYCRAGRGERPFADEQAAALFVDTLARVKAEHGLTILAWCLMPNHYHLVVRSGELPLWRSMRLLQGRFTKALNRRDRVLGPLWQGRYKSRMIEDPAYLMQAIAYVHLNPVTAGMTADPASHRWSGHRQVLGRERRGLVDVDETLLVFSPQRTAARRAYLTVLGQGREAAWKGTLPDGLPWWRRAAADDEELRRDSTRPGMDWLGVTQRPAPPKVDAKEVARTVARLLGVSVTTLRGRRRGAELGRVRELVMLVGVETCGLKVKDLAAVIGRDPGSASRLYGQATTRRREDPGYAALAQGAVEALRRHERVRDDAQ